MKKALKFLIPVFVLAMLATALSFIATADEDPFDGLSVIYVANESKGTGDGSTPENAIGNADDYVSGYPTTLDGEGKTVYVNQTSKTALARAYAALGNSGGTIVLVDEVVIDACDTKRSSPAEYTIGSTTDNNPYRITSVYGGVNYGEKGAKLVIDQASNVGLGIRIRVPMTIENLTIDYKYTTGNEWYGNHKTNGTKPTVLISFWGKGGVIGEGVVVNSVPDATSKVKDAKPSLIAGDRFQNFSSADLTIKSGSWYMVTGTHGMTEAYPGTISGDVNITVEGGEIEYLFGEGTLDTAHSKWGAVQGSVNVTVGENAKVGTANGSVANNAKTGKTITYDVNAIAEDKISNFETVTPTGELKETEAPQATEAPEETTPETEAPEVDPFEGLPRIYIASAAKGTGDGSSPENAMGNADDYVSKDKTKWKSNALRRGFDALKSTGGVVVVVGPLTVDTADDIRESPAEFTVVDKSAKEIKLTSVDGGVDYRTSGNAKLTLDQASVTSLTILFRSPVTIENIDIEYKYSEKGNGWETKEKATVYIAFEGQKSTIGEGVKTIASPTGKGTPNRYPTLIAGHRYSEVPSTDLTIKSGTWDMVICSTRGMSEKYPGVVKGDAKVTILGGTVNNLYGEGANDKRSENSKVEGKIEVIIGKGALVKNANGSPAKNDGTNKSITYDVTSINKANITNFGSVTQTGEGNPPPATGSYLTVAIICAVIALGTVAAIVSKRSKIEE